MQTNEGDLQEVPINQSKFPEIVNILNSVLDGAGHFWVINGMPWIINLPHVNPRHIFILDFKSEDSTAVNEQTTYFFQIEDVEISEVDMVEVLCQNPENARIEYIQSAVQEIIRTKNTNNKGSLSALNARSLIYKSSDLGKYGVYNGITMIHRKKSDTQKRGNPKGHKIAPHNYIRQLKLTMG